ncbi:glutathione-dependent formaldehyde-activating [Tieghemostelium lacteum]|uniref:Glutathione-dependent formaldehyde-activating n=1 Tax=Tieghemostelium lacteum TaxID=361077 RepID=A0A151ZGN1_TIELA|nr:glutathione-dependent formaldehyde-activating [Tieghemostelium lacteum]|eukprot:KYQ93077.1 glutathione-dependent formaldehyde-activating [Tieghemostelium lacteum]
MFEIHFNKHLLQTFKMSTTEDQQKQQLKTYNGSCHCKAITYEAEMDLSQGTGKCNCSICFKSRNWIAFIKDVNQFKLLTGKEMLGNYQFGKKTCTHHFCKACGVRVYLYGNMGNFDFICLNVPTIDNLSQKEFSELTIKCSNGASDDFYNQPEFFSHL